MDTSQDSSTTRCRGYCCFQKDWCARWDPDPPEGAKVFPNTPIDQFGRCEFFIEKDDSQVSGD